MAISCAAGLAGAIGCVVLFFRHGGGGVCVCEGGGGGVGVLSGNRSRSRRFPCGLGGSIDPPAEPDRPWPAFILLGFTPCCYHTLLHMTNIINCTIYLIV